MGQLTEFRDDLIEAVRVWRRVPAMVVIELALGLMTFAGGTLIQSGEDAGGPLLTLALLVLQLAYLGWLGGQRVVYAAAFRDQPVPSPAAMASLSRPFIGRFFMLGAVAALVTLPLFVLAFVAGSGSTTVRLLFIVWVVGLDVLATLITPALALDTNSVRAAVRTGITLLRRNWESVRWHALVAPLLLVALPGILGADAAVTVLANLLSIPLLLAVRGAVVRVYLRLDHEGVVAA